MRLILFDVDGTLINSAGAGRRAMERAFADLHGLLNALDGVQLHGRADPVIIRDAFERGLGRSPDSGEIERIVDRLVAHLPEELNNSPGYRVLPGVREILTGLARRDDVLLGLETGNTLPGARLKLSHGGIWGYFRCGGYGTDGEIRSEIVRAAVRNAELIVGSGDVIQEVWVIGDTPLDIEAGKAVGARIVATATGMHDLDLLRAHQPDLAVSDLTNTSLLFATILGDSDRSD